jgi:preprotein translocase subunit SecA
MEILERIWDVITHFFGSMVGGFERTVTNLFGSSNARTVKKMQSRVDAINSLEPKYEKLTDDQLREESEKFRDRLNAGETLDDIMVEAFAVCREGGKRFLNMRHYDVQLVGGMVLHGGNVAEMVTGEGKTLVATLPAYLNALAGRGVHVITVNDYLARRDMEWMAPLYMGLGLTVNAIQGDMQGAEGTRRRQAAYACDITYGTNNEFGFDYLRDNMRPAARGDERFPKRLQQSQGTLAYAIIDEVDNILIDEARTPLIISGPAHQDPAKYAEANRIATALKKEEHFTVNEKDHTATLTDEGVRFAEQMAGVESFYTAGNMDWPHMIDNALKAHNLYKIDVNYVIKEGTIVIVDEFTGRLMEGRQWSDGLHQAVEAKEGVKIKEETQTLATITLQNYFKLYDKLSGMTGTAMTEANEFWKIYELDVIAIPTNKVLERIAHPDIIYATEKYKWRAVADEVEAYHKWDMIELKNGEKIVGTIKSDDDSGVVISIREDGSNETYSHNKVDKVQYRGRPVLVGTTTIEKSEHLSQLLDRRGVEHEVLNAKNHKREAEIVAQAGRRGSVTIATNMAGRGTDIVLGGNPENMAWAQLQETYATRLDVPPEEWDELTESIDKEYKMSEEGELVKELGGLHVVGTERHDARRIDLQLRGRCGRQGDPGSSRFFLSLDDDLMRIFAGPFVKRILEMGGFKDDMPLESRMVSRRIDSAQKKREEFNFEIRKNLLEYDEVMDEQRKRIYRFRQQILDGLSGRETVIDMVRDKVDRNLMSYLAPDFGMEQFAAFAGSQLACSFEPRSFKNVDIDEAIRVAKDEAERAAESDIIGAIDENLPAGEEEGEWNWSALARFANTRYQLSLRDSDLKKVGRDRVDELIADKSREAIQKVDLSMAAPMLDPDYGVRVGMAWVKDKIGLEIDPESIDKNATAEEIRDMVVEKAEELYEDKEAAYPVMAGMYRFMINEGGQSRVDREGLIAWAQDRFQSNLTMESFKNKQRDEIRELLMSESRNNQQAGLKKQQEVGTTVEQLINEGSVPLRHSEDGLKALEKWFDRNLSSELPTDQVEKLDADELSHKMESLVDHHYHPEMRRMERIVLLEIVDSAWKDHLLAMDYLRSAVGQRGMAQLDPKVEYKREGMRMFETLWDSIGERVTDLIFKMEHLPEDFVSNTFVETNASHAPAPVAASAANQSQISQEQQAAIDNSGGKKQVVETIRNRGQKVGRNDPCTCGSGKKYKACCMRKQAI